jgi:hypothetical protein
VKRIVSLFNGPQEHAANPPSTWEVHKAAPRLWQLRTRDGGVLHTTTTKRAAEDLRTSGFYASQYAKEGRWYAGESVPGWKPYRAPEPAPRPFPEDTYRRALALLAAAGRYVHPHTVKAFARWYAVHGGSGVDMGAALRNFLTDPQVQAAYACPTDPAPIVGIPVDDGRWPHPNGGQSSDH